MKAYVIYKLIARLELNLFDYKTPYVSNNVLLLLGILNYMLIYMT